MLIVSKCLAGVPCRYDGKDNLIEADLDGKKMDYKEYLKNIK